MTPEETLSQRYGIFQQCLLSETRREVTITTSDGAEVNANKLWLFSPLVRSVLDSFDSLGGNVLILPDFTKEDVVNGLNFLLASGESDVIFVNAKEKALFEVLGIPFKEWKTVDKAESVNKMFDDWKSKMLEIKKEKEEEAFAEEFMKNQDLSDSDDGEDEEEDKSENLDGSQVQPSEQVKETLFAKWTSLIKMPNNNKSKSSPVKNDKKKITRRVNKEVKIRFEDFVTDENRSKVEEALSYIENDGNMWKCKVCDKTHKLRKVIKCHVEIHVAGLEYKCIKCPEVRSTHQSIDKHFRKNH